MATYFTLLTKIGQASVANAVALNQKVNLTSMAVGDGNGNPTTPNENQTALVREKYRATINQLTVDPSNPNYIIAEMIIPTTVGGWSIYEVGVFDDQERLIAVANFPATYKPELAEGSGRDLIVRIVIQVSNVSVVTLKVDPAITLASQAWVAANYVKKVTVAGGTTGQVLVKKSNANEDFKWVDPTAAVDVNVFSREETQTLAAGQTVVNLAQLTTDGAAVYIEGVRLRNNQFTVNSATRLTFPAAYPAGTRVTIVQNEETSRNAFMLKANNLSDVENVTTAKKNLQVDRIKQGATYSAVFSNNLTNAIVVNDNGDWGAQSNTAWIPLGVARGGTGALTAEDARNNLGITNLLANKQDADPMLAALAALVTAANKIPYFTGADQISLADLSAFMRGLLGSADAAAAKTGLGLGSAADRAVGNTALTQIPDMSFFQTTNNNVFRFPNGLMIQAFGVLPSASSTTTSFSFPVSFPNNVIVVNANYNTGSSINIYAFNNLTKNGGDMRVYVPNSATPTTGGGTAAIIAVGY